MSTFEARYPGTCAADCGQRIHPGQNVTYVDEQLVHATCADHPPPARREPAVCPSCWTVHRGECL
jgi:hypothetical protein